MRLGLCCKFEAEPIRFRAATARYLQKLVPRDRSRYLADIATHNAESLLQAVQVCDRDGIGSFRIGSDVFPLSTHPELGYNIAELPQAEQVLDTLSQVKAFAASHTIRLTFHPDQFVVLNSSRPVVVQSAIQDLKYHAEIAAYTGADVINIHAGGVYGDKDAALVRLRDQITQLPANVRNLLTLENDDRSYTPADLLPVCQDVGVPLVYDVHHHRCNPDGMSEAQAFERALATWDREPLVHISSPRDGWDAANPRPHAACIDPADFPTAWLGQNITVEVEAKHKEVAVRSLLDILPGMTALRIPQRSPR